MGWTTLLQQQKGVLAAGEQQRGEGYVHPWAASTIESQPASPAGSSEEGRQAPDSLTRWASKERILMFLILQEQRVNKSVHKRHVVSPRRNTQNDPQIIDSLGLRQRVGSLGAKRCYQGGPPVLRLLLLQLFAATP